MTPHSANFACKKRGAGIIFCLATASSVTFAIGIFLLAYLLIRLLAN